MNPLLADLIQTVQQQPNERPAGYFIIVSGEHCLIDNHGQFVAPNGTICPDEYVKKINIIKEDNIAFSCEKKDLQQHIVSTIQQHATQIKLPYEQTLLNVNHAKVMVGQLGKRSVANTILCSYQFYDHHYNSMKEIIEQWIVVDTNHVLVGRVGPIPVDKPFGVIEHETTYDVLIHPQLSLQWVSLPI